MPIRVPSVVDAEKEIDRSASIYFAIQGTAVFAWWAILGLAPSTRSLFQMGESETVLLSFWLPYTILLGPGSLIAAILCWKSVVSQR